MPDGRTTVAGTPYVAADVARATVEALSGEDEPDSVIALLVALDDAFSSGTCNECGRGDASGAVDANGIFRCCACSFEVWTAAVPSCPVAETESVGNLAAPLHITELSAGGCPVAVLSDPYRRLFSGVGVEVWPAAQVLLEFFVSTASCTPPGCRVLELGAGCGTVGFWLARHRGAHTCVTDLPRLCPLLRLIAEANGLGDIVEVRPLRWGCAEDVSHFLGDCVDLVVGADLCYHPALLAPLLETLEALAPRDVLLALPDRSGCVTECRSASVARGWRWRSTVRQRVADSWIPASMAVDAARCQDDVVVAAMSRSGCSRIEACSGEFADSFWELID